MKKEFRVVKNYEFSAIIGKRQFVKTPAFVAYFVPKSQEHARVGISVGKKLGNAVSRNKVKRQVRAMVDSIFNFQEDYDTILIVRPVYLQRSYQDNMADLQGAKTRIEKRKVKL